MLIVTGTAVALVIVLVVVQQLTSGDSGRPDPSQLVGTADVQAEFDGLTERSGTLGPASANVTIVEYGDLVCPICKSFDNEVVPQLISDFVRTGKAKLEFRDWPIVGPSSVPAAHAAYAARRQNALWRFAALTYLNQGDERESWFSPALARSLASAVGLDVKRFDRDRTSAAAGAYVAKVDKEARALGFPGTPSIRVVGPGGASTVAASYGAIAAAVEGAGGAGG
jgi:protein-disulfide isomerase